jgi:acyl dehydratase
MTTRTTQTIRFDDLAALEGAVSEDFGPWGPEVEITQSLIDAFAEVSGDHQWIHVDVERARRESPFGAPIAHGFLTLSLLARLEPASVEITGHASAANYGGERLRFLAPVPVGSRIHARARLVAALPRATGVVVTTEIDVRVVGADKPSMLYRMQSLYMPPRGL